MPNKIVQLVDNDNNNIYPVAGSLAQGSVTTSTINDGAVTASKINDEAVDVGKVDFATMKGYASSLPTVSKANTIALLGNTLVGTLTRYGDLVFLRVNGIISSSDGYDEHYFGAITAGYKPIASTIAPGNMTAGASQTGCFSLSILPDGTINGSCPAISGETRVQVFGCWLTGDAWPS